MTVDLEIIEVTLYTLARSVGDPVSLGALLIAGKIEGLTEKLEEVRIAVEKVEDALRGIEMKH